MIPSSLTPIANHLWQSTVFVIVLGLITLLLKNNRAHVRSLVWLAASIKFLLPFSLLVAIGSQLPWIPAIAATPAELAFAVEQISQPFNATRDGDATPVTAATTYSFNELLLILVAATWVAGSIAVLVHWFLKSRRIRAAVRNGTRIVNGREVDALRRVEGWRPTAAQVKVVSSADVLEPGIVGIFRPVLLLPAGIADRLADDQLDAIITHEVCHVRRRDNLTAALHMIVETLFWFHPLVWWLGKRLVDEREKACDEEVLRRGNSPQVYAEGILKVCEFYVESPVACVAGVTGSNLKKRIEGIMKNGIPQRLNLGRKLLLGFAVLAAIAGPVFAGLANPSSSPAQSSVAFEVASVKRNNSGTMNGFIRRPNGGRFVAQNVTLKDLVRLAYGFQDFQILSAPRWTDSDKFDVEAKASVEFGPGQLELMLQSLLADRFRMRSRRETRNLAVYELIVGRNGPKLTLSKEGDGASGTTIQSGKGLMLVKHAAVDQWLGTLSSTLGRRVIDKTELTGSFDFRMEWSPEIDQPPGEIAGAGPGAAPPVGPAGPSIFTALQDQLGLQLKPATGPVEIIVIESVEMPSEN